MHIFISLFSVKYVGVIDLLFHGNIWDLTTNITRISWTSLLTESKEFSSSVNICAILFLSQDFFGSIFLIFQFFLDDTFFCFYRKLWIFFWGVGQHLLSLIIWWIFLLIEWWVHLNARSIIRLNIGSSSTKSQIMISLHFRLIFFYHSSQHIRFIFLVFVAKKRVGIWIFITHIDAIGFWFRIA